MSTERRILEGLRPSDVESVLSNVVLGSLRHRELDSSVVFKSKNSSRLFAIYMDGSELVLECAKLIS